LVIVVWNNVDVTTHLSIAQGHETIKEARGYPKRKVILISVRPVKSGYRIPPVRLPWVAIYVLVHPRELIHCRRVTGVR